MKKIFLSIMVVLTFGISNASALCIQCPEIQKQLKKEITLSKEQKNEIKLIKKDMKAQIKNYEKEYNKNQKKVNKILKADCPDIIKMMEIKNQNAEIKRNTIALKNQKYGELFAVYTPDQQETAKRILSENYGILTKKPCDFCNENPKLRPKCKKCNSHK